MSKKQIEQRRQHARQRQARLWVGGGVVIAALGLAFVWWTTRGGASSGGTPIGRISANDFHSLAFSPTEPDTVFFGHHGGLMVSRDGGRSWQATTLQDADAMALAAPAADPQTIYAAGHGVLFRSSDGGVTWESLIANLPGSDIHGFAADSANANAVFAHVVGSGVWGSQDGGGTWTLLSSGAPPSTFNLAVGQTAQTLYAAAGEAGLWRSQGGGQAWERLANAPGDGVVAVAYHTAAERLFITTLGAEAGLYASEDEGATWSSLGLKGTLVAMAVSPQDAGRLLAVDGQGRVYASRDGGTTWPND